MTLTSVALKMITVAGTAVVGVMSSVLVVANDPKPGSAPLQPHLASSQSSPDALAPLPPSCGTVGSGKGQTAVTLTTQQKAELKQLQQTPEAQRRALLLTFSSADRMQIAAYMAQQRKNAATAKGGKAGTQSCGKNSSSAPSISSSTQSGGNTIAPVITYVS